MSLKTVLAAWVMLFITMVIGLSNLSDQGSSWWRGLFDVLLIVPYLLFGTSLVFAVGGMLEGQSAAKIIATLILGGPAFLLFSWTLVVVIFFGGV